MRQLEALAVVAIVVLLWIAGEQHKQSCIAAQRVSCSIAPWDHGERVSPAARFREYGARDPDPPAVILDDGDGF